LNVKGVQRGESVMVPAMSGWLTRIVQTLFGPGKPSATSAALMVGQAAKSPGPEDEKSVLSLALERAKAGDPAPQEDSSPLVLDAPIVGGEADAAQSAAAAGAKKKPPKKRAPRKRKVAPAAASELPPEEDVVSASLVSEEPSEPMCEDDVGPTAGGPEADVWVSDAVAWSLSGRWSAAEEMWTPPPGAEAPRRLEEFREKAAEGKLVIWGRAGEVGMWEPIEAAYWRWCGIEQFSFLEGREKVFTEPKTAAKAKPGRATAAKYTALKVNRRQVEEVWQPGTMH